MGESKVLRDFFNRHRTKWRHRAHTLFQGVAGKPEIHSQHSEYLKRGVEGEDAPILEPSAKDALKVFEENAQEYDEWFDRHPAVFESELAALRELVPLTGRGVEIGAGTGRFSKPFGIKVGVEPATGMATIARSRGLEIHQAMAERLPFRDASFDFALLVTAICFFRDPLGALRETHRILKPGGLAITAFLDRESRLGQAGLPSHSKFYQKVGLFTPQEIKAMLEQAGFKWREARQTLFSQPVFMTAPDVPKPGFGEGDFVVFSATPIK